MATSKGIFVPKNPSKYVGKSSIKYRSSWELVFMRFLDDNPSVINWGSECLHIPYKHPIKNKNTIYVPDFFIVYVDKNGKKHAEVIEIKPLKESVMEQTRSPRDRIMLAINLVKWQAAQAWCAANNMAFRLVTEQQLFRNGKK
jgi:hypothetical protein